MNIEVIIAIIGSLGVSLPIFIKIIKDKKKRTLDMNTRLFDRVELLTKRLEKYQEERVNLSKEKSNAEIDLNEAIKIEEECKAEIILLKSQIVELKNDNKILSAKMKKIEKEYKILLEEIAEYTKKNEECIRSKEELKLKIKKLQHELDNENDQQIVI